MTDEELDRLEEKNNFSGFDRSTGVEVIRKLINVIRDQRNAASIPFLGKTTELCPCACGYGSMGEFIPCGEHAKRTPEMNI